MTRVSPEVILSEMLRKTCWSPKVIESESMKSSGSAVVSSRVGASIVGVVIV
jgi:hypothetical protein